MWDVLCAVCCVPCAVCRVLCVVCCVLWIVWYRLLAVDCVMDCVCRAYCVYCVYCVCRAGYSTVYLASLSVRIPNTNKPMGSEGLTPAVVVRASLVPPSLFDADADADADDDDK